MDTDDRDSLRHQIQLSMEEKETDELLEIWEAGDHKEWTDTAFEVVREILLARVVEIPPQGSSDQKPVQNPGSNQNVPGETGNPNNKVASNFGKFKIFLYSILALCFINIGLAIYSTNLYGGVAYCPGDTVELNTRTADPVDYGKFYPRGFGRLQFIEKVPAEISSADWEIIPGHGSLVPGGVAASSYFMAHGEFNVEISIPKISILDRTLLVFRIWINGSGVQKAPPFFYAPDLGEMASKLILLTLAPSHMCWLVHQQDWVVYSIVLAALVFFGFIRKGKDIKKLIHFDIKPPSR